MAKRKYSNIIILIVFAIYVIFYGLFLSNSNLQYGEFINAAVLIVIAFITILLLGFRRDKLTNTKKSILGMTITEVLIFFAISFGLGIVTGFLKNSYALDFISICKNIFIPIVYLIGIEIFRYTLLNANGDKKIIVYATTILITILELSMNLSGVYMYDFETIFKTTSAIIIPTIIKNATLSYLVIHGGLKPVLFYRLIMDTYSYILPIVPDLGDYINSVIGILLPTFIYMNTARIVEEDSKEETEEDKRRSGFRISDIPMFIVIILLVGLISGRFMFGLIGIGSESMTPTIDKGDAVLYKQVKEDQLEVGDILVFNSGSKIIIHRLVEIKKDGDKTYYITKGDANNGNDSLNLTIDNIKGKVLFKIKYIAYPSLFLKDLVDKG